MIRIAEDDLKHVLKYTKTIWEHVKGKNIFITGGTGFFGKWLLESFLYANKKQNLNASITILSRYPEKFLEEFPFYKDHEEVIFLKGNVIDFKFPNGKYHFIIHAATEADASLNTEFPLLMLDTIVQGTRRILEFAKEKQVESFLLISSGAVYGKQPFDITHIKESDSFFIDINNPNSAYAEGKRVSELYSSIYYKRFGIPIKIARCFAFVGPYLPLYKHFAIGNFILNGLKSEDIIIKGDGTPYRSYLYAGDLAIWLWTILINGNINTPYNVGSDFAINIKETAEAVSDAFDNKIGYKILQNYSGKPIERYVPSVSNATNNLGLKVYINISNSIKKTISFYSINKF